MGGAPRTTSRATAGLTTVTRDDAAEAIRSSLEQSGWTDLVAADAIDDLIRDTIDAADEHPVGTIIERRLDDINERH